MSCPAEAMEMPVIFLTPSSTFEIPLSDISRAPMFSIATFEAMRSVWRLRSDSRFLRPLTVTDWSVCASGASSIVSSSSAGMRTSTCCVR